MPAIRSLAFLSVSYVSEGYAISTSWGNYGKCTTITHLGTSTTTCGTFDPVVSTTQLNSASAFVCVATVLSLTTLGFLVLSKATWGGIMSGISACVGLIAFCCHISLWASTAQTGLNVSFGGKEVEQVAICLGSANWVLLLAELSLVGGFLCAAVVMRRPQVEFFPIKA